MLDWIECLSWSTAPGHSMLQQHMHIHSSIHTRACTTYTLDISPVHIVHVQYAKNKLIHAHRDTRQKYAALYYIYSFINLECQRTEALFWPKSPQRRQSVRANSKVDCMLVVLFSSSSSSRHSLLSVCLCFWFHCCCCWYCFCWCMSFGRLFCCFLL